MKNLLVICGGQSPEHAISVRSAKNILNALDASKYNVTLIGISKEGFWTLLTPDQLDGEINSHGKRVTIVPGSDEFLQASGHSLGKFDAAFPILHGPNGEDGTMQGLLKLMNVPFVGPGVLGSAVSMDKDITKRLLADAQINVAKWRLIRRGDEIPSYDDLKSELGSVLFVKPANMGSSVGVHRVSSSDQWDEAILDALNYDRRVLVEESVNGRELECAVRGNDHPQASGVGEVQSGNFYSFEEKYDAASEAQVVIPAQIDDLHIPKLKETAIKAYRALDCQGMSRVDMFLTDDGKIYVNEVNTIPGFTSISMYPKLWEEADVEYSELLDQLIDFAIERHVE